MYVVEAMCIVNGWMAGCRVCVCLCRARAADSIAAAAAAAAIAVNCTRRRVP